MSVDTKLGYLIFDVRRPDRWTEFCRSMLGLPDPVANRDGSIGYQIDDAAQRVVVTPGKADDLAALGFECRNHEVFERLADRLGRAGVRAEPGSAELAATRQVERLVR